MRCHRNPYDQALIMAGAKLIEVGNAIETHLYEVEGAINEKTVGIVFLYSQRCWKPLFL